MLTSLDSSGLIMMGWGGKLGVRYAGAFLAIAGCQANVPAGAAYQANNIVSQSKRAVGSALLVGWGGVGGIVASLIYRQADYPKYIPGISGMLSFNRFIVLHQFLSSFHAGTIAFQVLIFLSAGTLSLYFKRQNKLADEGKIVIENQPGFRYTI